MSNGRTLPMPLPRSLHLTTLQNHTLPLSPTRMHNHTLDQVLHNQGSNPRLQASPLPHDTLLHQAHIPNKGADSAFHTPMVTHHLQVHHHPVFLHPLWACPRPIKCTLHHTWDLHRRSIQAPRMPRPGRCTLPHPDQWVPLQCPTWHPQDGSSLIGMSAGMDNHHIFQEMAHHRLVEDLLLLICSLLRSR